jgi:hypothetical protein
LNCAEKEEKGNTGKSWFKTHGTCTTGRRKKAECDEETRIEDENKQ